METLISSQNTHTNMDTTKKKYLLSYLRENPKCGLSDEIKKYFAISLEYDLNTLWKKVKREREAKREEEDLEYRTKWGTGVTFEIEYPNEEYDPTNLAVDVSIIAQDGNAYIANFVTRKFIDYMFEKNIRTGECGNGIYFCMPGMVIVDEVTQLTVKKTIEDLIKNREMEEYFRNYDI